mgnify:FL=1
MTVLATFKKAELVSVVEGKKEGGVINKFR